MADDVLDQIDQTTDADQQLDTTLEDTTLETTADADGADKHLATDSDKVDGRKFPQEWSKALKELRELYPDRADMLTKLRDTYGRYGAVGELAPKGVEEIRQWKTTLDALGGSEAAADMMQRTAAMEAVDERIESGDYGVIAELSPEWQKGFYQMLPDALTDLSTKDPQAFSAAVMPHFAAALEGTGMGDHLKKMYAAAGDNEPLKELIKQQYDWLQSQIAGKGQLQGNKTVSPELARAQKQLETYQQGERESFVNSVLSTRDKAIDDSFNEHVAVYKKQLGLTDSQVADLQESFAAKVKASQVEGTPFFKQLKAYSALKTRDMATVDTYIKSATTQDAKTIIDGLVTARYGGMRQKAKPVTTGTTTTDAGVTRVAQDPPRDQWDMEKMDAAGYDATAKVGKFFLNGGRTVQRARPN
jgi:hypothetical protein